ncbi:MAG: hypothetical protein ACRCS9_02215 [Hyphomicrobium sp.]
MLGILRRLAGIARNAARDPLHAEARVLRKVPVVSQLLPRVMPIDRMASSAIAPLRWVGLQTAFAAGAQHKLKATWTPVFSQPFRATSGDVMTIRLLTRNNRLREAHAGLELIAALPNLRELALRETLHACRNTLQNQRGPEALRPLLRRSLKDLAGVMRAGERDSAAAFALALQGAMAGATPTDDGIRALDLIAARRLRGSAAGRRLHEQIIPLALSALTPQPLLNEAAPSGGVPLRDPFDMRLAVQRSSLPPALRAYAEAVLCDLAANADTSARDGASTDARDLSAALGPDRAPLSVLGWLLRLDQIASTALLAEPHIRTLRDKAFAAAKPDVALVDAAAAIDRVEQSWRRGAVPTLPRAYGALVRQIILHGLGGDAGPGAENTVTGAIGQRLADGGDDGLGPWRAISAYRLFERDEDARQRKRADARKTIEPSARPLRVLTVSENWQFAETIPPALEANGIDVARANFADVRNAKSGPFQLWHLYVPSPFLPDAADIRKQLTTACPDFAAKLDWADVVLVDWCNAGALWLSRFLAVEKRLVVRLHSYEAFREFPHTMNWGGVDGLIFVAEPIRRIVNALAGPRLAAVAQSTLPNVNTCVVQPPSPDPERAFVLGMAGYATENKNPNLALDILKRLRTNDARYRLRLIGRPWPDDATLTPTEILYRQDFMRRLDDPALAGAVSLEPYTTKIHDWFRDIGFMLSTSDREGTHEAIAESMAVGCVPVVRDWPFVKRFGGAASVYAGLDSFIFASDTEAAAIIARENSRFSQAANDAQAYFKSHFHADVVGRRLAAFLSEIAHAQHPGKLAN